MEVAPVDAEIIAGAAEDVLIARADIEDGKVGGLGAAPGYGLIGSVNGDDGIHVDKNRDLVAAVAAGGEAEIGDGARKDVEVFGKCGRKEGGGEFDTRCLELIDGVRGRDFERGLLHGGDFARIVTHEAVGLAVDAGDAIDGLTLAGPMRGVLVSEVVGVQTRC